MKQPLHSVATKTPYDPHGTAEVGRGSALSRARSGARGGLCSGFAHEAAPPVGCVYAALRALYVAGKVLFVMRLIVLELGLRPITATAPCATSVADAATTKHTFF